MDGNHGQTTLGVTCHHRLWTTHTVERCRAWHAIITFGQHKWLTTSGVACHHRLWAVHTVERHWAWHAIIAHGRQAQSNDVRCDIPSPPLDNTYDRTTLGRACHHRLWAAHTVERCRAWHDISRLCTTHCHDPLDTQEDRDPSTQPAASARGTNSPKRPAGKGPGVQVGSRQRVRRFSRYRQFQQLQPFH